MPIVILFLSHCVEQLIYKVVPFTNKFIKFETAFSANPKYTIQRRSYRARALVEEYYSDLIKKNDSPLNEDNTLDLIALLLRPFKSDDDIEALWELFQLTHRVP
eukprot:GHVH01015124.1.p1 GENE.GHVH01015124.1~~GHVH01015124.1.p1  ORF type:complete len:104 (+),score=12.50 GHVH01015124.1:1024-1335(+)